jgi:hypothetical protein
VRCIVYQEDILKRHTKKLNKKNQKGFYGKQACLAFRARSDYF